MSNSAPDPNSARGTPRVLIALLARGPRPSLEATIAALPASAEAICIVGEDGGHNLATARSLASGDRRIAVLGATGRLGYGDAQKLALAYATREGFDLLAVLPNEAPGTAAALDRLLEPFGEEEVAAVFGSRLGKSTGPVSGSMPMYKRIGNRLLTGVQNRLLGTRVGDFHSSCRVYRVSALTDLPVRHNSSGLHFDTEVAIQLSAKRRRIVDVSIPPYAGGEVRGLATVGHALQSLLTVVRAKANRVYLVYHPKFDLDDDDSYVFKHAPTSLHQFVLTRSLPREGDGTRVVELGAGHGGVSHALHERGYRPLAVDYRLPAAEFPFPYLEIDLEEPFADRVHGEFGTVDTVIALDVIEHLENPERSLAELHRMVRPGGRLIASTGNVAFALQRALLFFGEFNYGKKGILDLTHKRLFTVRSFRRTLEGEGFKVRSVRGFGPPIEDMVGSSWPLRMVDRFSGFLARVWPSMFGYQFLVEAERLESPEAVFVRALADRSAPPAD